MNTYYRAIALVLVLAYFVGLTAQEPDRVKELKAIRISEPIRIDGVLNESVWANAPFGSAFTTMLPEIGKPASLNSEVMILYDEHALYIGARLYDNKPDSILRELSNRDWGGVNADVFGVQINPYNDGQNCMQFEVSAANLQKDLLNSATSSDKNWSAVWKSNISFTNEGWFVEMRIPFTVFRFPNKPEQEWSINFFRDVKRLGEISTWNFVDRTKASWIAQHGRLKGIENIKQPFRLELYPYLSGNYENNPDGNAYGYSAGMDIKIGLSNAYTMDMTLIPDFGQRKSDYEVLNLSPYETHYDENRAFFTEGMDLFGKTGLLYTRRIGKKPSNFDAVKDSVFDGDRMLANPGEAKLINATKIYGRDSEGVGFGLLNAFTLNTYAEIQKKDGSTRRLLTEPASNYNMVVYDRTVGKFSYYNIANTNVYQPETGKLADVAGALFRFANDNNEYSISGKTSYSYRRTPDENLSEGGGMISLTGGKTSGNFRATYTHDLFSDTYDPNDMGYLSKSNFMNNYLWLWRGSYEPSGHFLNWGVSTNTGFQTLYKPMRFSEFWSDWNFNATFRNYMYAGMGLWTRPFYSRNFDEPREDGRFYLGTPYIGGTASWGTDGRKKVSVSTYANYGISKTNTKGPMGHYYLSYYLNFRLSSKLSLGQGLTYSKAINDEGYVDSWNRDTVFFGRRDIPNLTTTVSGSYVFNNRHSLRADIRHYWSSVNYHQFYFLQPNGHLTEQDVYNPADKDRNFNTFNIDLIYTWNLAPGSFLTVMYKNNIYLDEEVTNEEFLSYNKNIRNMFSSPQSNSISLKLSYYLDYRQLFKQKNTPS